MARWIGPSQYANTSPSFRLHDPVASDRITVLDLLSHHSGLPRHDWVWMPPDRSHDEILAALRYLEPSYDIRSQYQYSNLGYMVAGMVAERVAGQPWEDLISKRLMQPLGIKHFSYSAENLEQADDAARPYVLEERTSGEDRRVRAPYLPICAKSAGGINMAISDIASYLSFQLADGCFDGNQLLSPTTSRAMRVPRVYASPSEFEEISDQHYGLGFSCYHYRDERVIGHSGSWLGWGSYMTMLPERQLGIAILTNRAPSPIREIVTYNVADRLCGKEPIPWLDRFKARRRQAVAQRKENRQAHLSARQRDAMPPRMLSDYAGDYDHPGYGRITIEAHGEALRWRYRGLEGILSHRHYDIFEMPETPGSFSPGPLSITFAYDREGRINRLSAPFEPMVADIIFARAPSGDALDEVFRVTCVGTYQSAATKLIVACNADQQLTLSPKGQPTYHLVPYQDRIFTIKELEGFRVEFQCGKDETVDAIIFHQPNGTFVAQRVAE